MSSKDGPPDDRTDDRTVFQPLPTRPPAAPKAPAPAPTTAPSAADMPPTRRIEVGDVLNDIFEVRRFIDRGGMGEVFEGVNVNTDERVAIKVILPHLAADANVQAMFRKEARTLTRLGHPALVQYRVLAQERTLGVLYIVTEFVDGQNLSAVLSTLRPSSQQLVALTRRLAEGLDAAHALGAIHRDMSPDNVMLEGGRLEGAKIIDFGIAKDLDPGSATIVGDGFAGKLNYVAPEQLGDFDREIGAWTDVYSLGLVILAVARGRDIELGGTLVDAVDKRRAGLDVSAVPEELRPVIELMVKPNPADRLRSMREVVNLLGHSSETMPPGAVAALPGAATMLPGETALPQRQGAQDSASVATWVGANLPLVAGGGGVLALLLAAGIYFAVSGGDKSQPAGKAPAGTATQVARPAADPAVTARAALEAGLPSVRCAWLEIVQISGTPDGAAIVLRGVAGKPAEAQGQVARMLAARNVRVAGINFEAVSPIRASECAPIEGFRQIRNLAGGQIAVAQRQFEMGPLGPDAGPEAGKIGAMAIIDVSLDQSAPDAALFGLEESGSISPLLTDRASITQYLQPLSPGKYRLELATTHKGWSGILLLTGKGPFAPELIGGPAGSRGPDWSQKFAALARERGWKSDMVWYKTVDDQAN